MTASRRLLLQAALAAAAAPVVGRDADAAETALVFGYERDAERFALERRQGAERFALERQQGAERFALGVASGQPRPDGVVLWTRLMGADLPPAVPVRWELAHDAGFARIAARGSETAIAADAHSVHAEAGGLEPARWYFYRFTALGQASVVGRTRTAPAPDAAVASLTFVTASCQRWDKGHYAAWRHAATEDVDLVAFLGDYIYEYSGTGVRATTDGRDADDLTRYRRRHALHKSDAQLQSAHAACPWLLVWDDHEVENDYAGRDGTVRSFDAAAFARQRGAAYKAYWEHMPLAKSQRPAADGSMRMHGRLDWGRLASLHLLDDRQYRDVQACRDIGPSVARVDCPDLFRDDRTLLGAAQERWLDDGWALDRPWNLLAQQTLMSRLARPADGALWTDGWDGYPAARRRLLGGAAARRVPGLVALGGDLHASYVAQLKPDYDDPASPVVGTEFVGTSISSEGPSQRTCDAQRRGNPHVAWAQGERRGYMRFTLTPSALQVRVRVLDDVRDPASGIATAAQFAVDAKRPGAEPA